MGRGLRNAVRNRAMLKYCPHRHGPDPMNLDREIGTLWEVEPIGT